LETVSGATTLIEIRSDVLLPSEREPVVLTTDDGFSLVGELALPMKGQPTATLITLHPLPTHGGFMDSHVFRKAANRLPEMANLAILRFNTRGTESPHGRSEGRFEQGIGEAADLRAAVKFVVERGLPNPWLVGWSFGTELALKYGADQPVIGAILLAPPLHRATQEEVDAWSENGKQLLVLVPEFDDYLLPDQAKARFAAVKQAEVLGIEGAKHLWVGENATSRVLNEIVRVVNPSAYPLPKQWPDLIP
jgi:hypothetical protein